jgi:hypothetical protein
MHKVHELRYAMNMNEGIKSVTLTKVCNIRPFKGATDSKQITLAVKYDGLTLNDIFAKALRQDVISWQNGPGRKGYDDLIDKSTVNVSAKAPGAVTVDPETAMVAKLMSMTPEEQKVELQRLQELAAKALGEIVEPKVTLTKVEPVELNI